jgi:hypothetical protein
MRCADGMSGRSKRGDMTKVAIVQLDDRNDEDLGTLGRLVQMNMAYAEAHGYGHIFVRNPDPSILKESFTLHFLSGMRPNAVAYLAYIVDGQ